MVVYAPNLDVVILPQIDKLEHFGPDFVYILSTTPNFGPIIRASARSYFYEISRKP